MAKVISLSFGAGLPSPFQAAKERVMCEFDFDDPAMFIRVRIDDMAVCLQRKIPDCSPDDLAAIHNGILQGIGEFAVQQARLALMEHGTADLLTGVTSLELSVGHIRFQRSQSLAECFLAAAKLLEAYREFADPNSPLGRALGASGLLLDLISGERIIGVAAMKALAWRIHLFLVSGSDPGGERENAWE